MIRFGQFALAVACAFVGLTFGPLLALLLSHYPNLAIMVCVGLFVLAMTGLAGMWMQGERGTIFAGLVPAIALDLWFLCQPFNLRF